MFLMDGVDNDRKERKERKREERRRRGGDKR